MAAGGSGASHGIGVNEIFAWINVLVVLVVIYFATRKTAVSGTKQAAIDFEKETTDSREKLQAINKDVAHTQKELENLDSKKKELINNFEKEAQNLKNKISKDAEQSALRIKQEAEAQSSNEQSSAQKEIKSYLVNKSYEKVINNFRDDNKKLTLHKKLISDFINEGVGKA